MVACRYSLIYTMPLPRLYTLSLCPLVLLSCCTEPEAPADTSPIPPSAANHKAEAPDTIVLHGHLICAYMNCFFKADPGTAESLRRQKAPAWMFEKDWGEEKEYQLQSPPEPEAYYAFRSTYLPPVRSFIRVPLADTHYEQSQFWDECCPVRVTLRVNPETGIITYTDYAPADSDFLRQMAEEYNRTVTAGIYKGLAGTATTEDMRGRALPVDSDWNEEPGPLTLRYMEEGSKAWEKAEHEAELVNEREKNTLPRLTPADGQHSAAWATFPSAKLGKGRIVRISGTPYKLLATGSKLVFSEDVNGISGVRLELPLQHPGVEKAPLLLCTETQNPPGSAEATILCLAPDGKSLVVVPNYDKSAAPVCISWRDGTPRFEEPVCYRSSLERTGIPTVLKFEGWLGNTPVVQHYRADGLSR